MADSCDGRGLEATEGSQRHQGRGIPGRCALLSGVLEPGSIDVVITSPPYPNEKDYTRTTRLESGLLGFIRNEKELRAR
jgi:hypothetical protein